MLNITVMRFLRMKYGITTRELSAAAGVSQQYISDMDLGKCGRSYTCELLAQKAFERIIEQRRGQAAELSAEYAGLRDRLLDIIAEDKHEL